MPKEVMKDSQGTFDLELRWGRDSSTVQIGLVTRDGRSLAETLEHEDYSSIWMNPDRYSINQLIMHLRRARNAVYGKDE